MLVLIVSVLLGFVSSKLLMVVEFSRHGAREPIYDFLKAKPFDSKGELTPVGMRQQYLLGQTLRTLYIEKEQLLSPNYVPREIYVRSTNYNRTILSANSQLMGLFPFGTGPSVPEHIDKKNLRPPFKSNYTDYDSFADEIDEKLQLLALEKAYQPIPVHVFALDQDILLRPFDLTLCPYNVNLQNNQYSSKMFKDWTEMFKDNTFKELSKAFNIPAEEMSLWVAFDIFDSYETLRFSNQPVPVNFSDELYRNLTFIHNVMVYYVYFGSEPQRKLLNTPIFNEIIRYFDGKINGTEHTKFVFYSGHDRTVSMILSGLNYSSPECIFNNYLGLKGNKSRICLEFAAYASTLIFELHEVDEKYEVMIRYNGDYLPMCGSTNSTSCNYTLFREKLKYRNDQ